MTGAQKILPNCGPTAFAIVARLPVEKVMAAYAERYNKGRSWQGRTCIHRLVKLAPRFDLKFGEEKYRGSLEKFVKREALQNRRYIVRVGDHCVAVADGKVSDQNGVDRLDKLARKRVTHVYWLKR